MKIAKRIGLTSRVQYAKRENGTVKIDVEEFIKIIQALGYTENDLSIFLLKLFPKKND
ncbi:helix-turn-helix domain-containing protein [Floricoccus penangensis]|uniref:helix-turn-helix domain-containing protein n=1 Tax=Floricoccus penangensis TaxID=1859475 RepID=UPI003B8386B0